VDILKKGRGRVKIYILLFLVLITTIITANHFASKVLKDKGYCNTWEFVTDVMKNYWNSRNVKVENVFIEIGEKNLKILENHREEALKRNVIINDLDGEYVSAKLEYKGKKVKVKLRLKGHMTDHLQKDKWSFRIKVTDKDYFMDMKRFSFQHPGTRGYFYEWIYHQLMKQENIIALNYTFINLTVNGRDWGIYAVEENFDEELIANNQRLKGPVIRFNPDMYWVHRYNMSRGIAGEDQFASYYSSNPVAYREEKVLDDSLQRFYYLKAIALIEGFRSNKITLQDAFDLERLAKFHAIIDLVGGHNSIDWSDIKYYYNPVLAKLEPVAYESFTNLSIKRLCGSNQMVSIDTALMRYENWHQALFSNKTFFKLYVKELERISTVDYLNKFFSEKNDALQNVIRINYKEFPFKKFNKLGYYKNQNSIKQFLHSPKALQAYINYQNADTIQLQLANMDGLPLKILGLISNNQFVAKPFKEIILTCKVVNEELHFQKYNLQLITKSKISDSLLKDYKLIYSVLGASDTLSTNLFIYPHTDNEFISNDLKNKQGNISEFSCLIKDEEHKSILFKGGKIVLTKDLIIPAGYTVQITSQTKIDLINYAKIISYSPIKAQANLDAPILFESSDHTGQGIELIQCNSNSIFNYVRFSGFPKIKDEQWKRSGLLTAYESSITVSNSLFENSMNEDALSVIRSQFVVSKCLFKNLANDGLDVDYSNGSVENCAFENCNENAMDFLMSDVYLNNISIIGSKNKAVNTKAGSKIDAKNIQIKNSRIAFSFEDFSKGEVENSEIENCVYGYVLYKNKPGAGYPQVLLKSYISKEVKTDFLKDEKSMLQIDGNVFTDFNKKIETTIRKGD
jgi:CotH kinase protein